jgi:hypothetical protein
MFSSRRREQTAATSSTPPRADSGHVNSDDAAAPAVAGPSRRLGLLALATTATDI